MKATTLLLSALAIGFAICPTTPAQATTASNAPTLLAASPNCVDATQNQTDSGISVRIYNSCSNAVDCHVSWSTRCGNGRAQNKRWDGSIEASSSQEVLVSAPDCGTEGWSIQAPVWNCSPKK